MLRENPDWEVCRFNDRVDVRVPSSRFARDLYDEDSAFDVASPGFTRPQLAKAGDQDLDSRVWIWLVRDCQRDVLEAEVGR